MLLCVSTISAFAYDIYIYICMYINIHTTYMDRNGKSSNVNGPFASLCNMTTWLETHQQVPISSNRLMAAWTRRTSFWLRHSPLSSRALTWTNPLWPMLLLTLKNAWFKDVGNMWHIEALQSAWDMRSSLITAGGSLHFLYPQVWLGSPSGLNYSPPYSRGQEVN